MKEKIILWFLAGLKKDSFRRRIVFWEIRRRIKKMKSWKTTTGGIGMIFGGLSLLAKAIVDGDYSQLNSVFVAVSGGIGLLLARDNDKSSEDVDIK